VAHDILNDSYENMVQRAIEIASDLTSDRLTNLTAYLDSALGCPPSRRDNSHVDPESCIEMEEAIGSDADLVGGELSSQLLELMNCSEMNLYNAKLAVDCCLSKLDEIHQNLDRETAQHETGARQLLASMNEISIEKARVKADERQRYESLIAQYCHLRFQELITRFVKVYYRVITKSLDVAKGMLLRCQSQVELIARDFEVEDEIHDTEADSGFNLDLLLTESVAQEINQHISKTELQVFESMIKESGGYLKLLNEPAVWQNQLPKQIRTAAQRVLADSNKKISLDKVIAQNSVEPERFAKWLNEKMCDARPLVDNCGGASRLMIGMPALSSKSVIPELLEKQFSVKGCTINGTQGNFVLCFEGEDISLASVAYRLLETRPDAIELVKRIQTRNDVDWKTLDDLL
jgi:hypothetical protein